MDMPIHGLVGYVKADRGNLVLDHPWQISCQQGQCLSYHLRCSGLGCHQPRRRLCDRSECVREEVVPSLDVLGYTLQPRLLSRIVRLYNWGLASP